MPCLRIQQFSREVGTRVNIHNIERIILKYVITDLPPINLPSPSMFPGVSFLNTWRIRLIVTKLNIPGIDVQRSTGP